MFFSAKYFDGQHAKPYQIELTFTFAGIELENKEENIKDYWPFKDLKVLAKPRHGRPGTLMYTQNPDARLHIEDSRAFEALARSNAKQAAHHYLTWHKIFFVCFAACFVFGFTLWLLPHLAGPIVNNTPESWQIKLGEHVIQPYIKEYGLCDGPNSQAGKQALDKLVDRLVESSDLKDRFHVQVINALDMVNAFAAPGGEIVIFSGLIHKAKSAEALTGVLAHEMSHVIKKHPAKGLIRDLGMYIVLLAIFGEDPGFGHQLIALKFSRDAEFEADDLAVDILNNANINPFGLAEFFATLQSLEQAGGIGMPDFLSTHPATHDRIQRMLSVKASQPIIPALTSKEWQAMQMMCDVSKK